MVAENNLREGAFVRGRAAEIPASLYIPPDALRIFLEQFEGPLDLLLYLIRRRDFDIMDIPLTELTAQYLRYVEEIVALEISLAAEYLLMSATLLEIKSRLLLPRAPSEEEEAEDPRADLVRRLLEYEQTRRAAERLGDLPRRGRDFISPQAAFGALPPPQKKPALNAGALSLALAAALERARTTAAFVIGAEPLSVRAAMSRAMRALSLVRRALFTDLFAGVHAGAGAIGVMLIAVLELGAERAVVVYQENPDAPLEVALAPPSANGE
jgi:segregation and condensation protein A